MSDLLNKASLVMIPSGYKEDIVYSAIPTDGSGDLSFTRASNGTRINSAGLVEVCPWNLAQYSEDFSNAYWNKYQSAITANATTAPNGTTTADKLEYTTTGTAVLFATSSALQNQVYALSCYAKQGTTNILQIGFTLSGGDKIANFNLNTGVITTTSSGVTASIESVGDGWYRCIMSLTTDINTPNVFINSTSGTTGNYIYIWGAQLNIGSTAKPYFPTTDRLNVARLTYQNGGGGCPSLLLEKQSTNLTLYSEQFDDSYWTEQNLTITANSGISPDGTQNADLFTLNTLNGEHNVYAPAAGLAITPNAQYTFSCYVKKGTGRYFCTATYFTGVGFGPYATFDLNTATLVSSGASYGTYVNSKIESMGNDWYRCSVTGYGNYSSLIIAPDIRSASALTPGVAFTGANETFYVWGAQCEQSSYVTSYIPTTSASATRVADTAQKTGISSLIGQTEGTILLDWKQNALSDSQGIYCNNKNLTGSISLQVTTSGTLVGFICYAGTYISIATSTNTIQVGQRYKLGLAYKSGDCAFYLNGNLIGTSTTTFAFTTTLDEIDLSNSTVYFAQLSEISVNELVQSKTRISNTELQSWSTL